MREYCVWKYCRLRILCSHLPWTRPLKTWLFPASVDSHSTEDSKIWEREITTWLMSGRKIGSSSTHCFARIAIFEYQKKKRRINSRIDWFSDYIKIPEHKNNQKRKIKLEAQNFTLYTQSLGYKFIMFGSMYSFKLAMLIEFGEFLRAPNIWTMKSKKCVRINTSMQILINKILNNSKTQK